MVSNDSLEDPGPNLLFHYEREKYQNSFVFVCFISFILLLLLVFNETLLRKVTTKLPESVLLILFGIICAAVALLAGRFDAVLDYITAPMFFNFLLPPIILDSAYQLYCKQFLFNLDGILLLALVGTTLNIFAIGGSLYAAYGMSKSHPILEMLLLSSIISAVDPVAVLAVFNQIGVQQSLYILIFGESLFNDGVTVVVFDTLEKIAFVDVSVSTYAYAVLSFFPIAFGGAVIGVFYGVLSALFCKYASTESKILEPTIIIILAYMSFLNSQLFHWSGIMALIGCGLTQKRYAFENIYEKSRVTMEIGLGVLAKIAETVIFLILGFKVLDKNVKWDFELIVPSIVFCVVFRFIFTCVIGYSINSYRLHKLTFNHLFIMSYGGLRGAVSFAMAASLHNEKVKELYMGATLAVILSTVFVQGSTIRFFVNLMHFKEQKHKENFTSATVKSINFHLLAGMEAILGGGSSSIHYWMEKFERFDKTHIQPILCIQPSCDYAFAGILELDADDRKFAQDHIMWGALDYARKKLANIPKQAKSNGKETDKTQVKKFEDIIEDKEDGMKIPSGTFGASDKLNEAWQKKLKLIQALREVSLRSCSSKASKCELQEKRSRPPGNGKLPEENDDISSGSEEARNQK